MQLPHIDRILGPPEKRDAKYAGIMRGLCGIVRNYAELCDYAIFTFRKIRNIPAYFATSRNFTA